MWNPKKCGKNLDTGFRRYDTEDVSTFPLNKQATLESIDRPNIVKQFHAAESMLACLLLELGRMEIAHGYLLRQAAVLLIRFGMDGEKAHVIGTHIVFLNKSMAERSSRRTESSFLADLNRHHDEPRQGMNDQLNIIKMRRSGGAQLGVFELLF